MTRREVGGVLLSVEDVWLSFGGVKAIQGVNFAALDYIIVFKDGNDTNLIAFSFNEVYSSGTWNTPFTPKVLPLSQGA